MAFFELLVLILTTLFVLVSVFKWKFRHWANKGVPHIKPTIPFGTSGNPLSKKLNGGIELWNHYRHFKSLGYKYVGMYAFVNPSLLLIDVEIVRNIMSKDFQYFTDRGLYCNEKDDPLRANLFNLEGQKWRTLRASITPTFTSGKIKMMFPTLIACGEPLDKILHEFYKKQVPLDIKDISARFTTDVIGSCAFGLECNSFKEPESEFRKHGNAVFFSSSKLRLIKRFIAFGIPSFAKWLGIALTAPETEKFFLNVVQETVNYRKQNNIIRNDFIQLVMNLKTEDENGASKELTIKEIAAQAFVFFLAGFETSSTTMTFCLYELSINQEIQNKVRNEIDTVLRKYDGKITYDAVMEMKYLNNVIDETLRKYPPAALLPRVCVKDYQIPDTDIMIDKGTRVLISVYGLHHDAEHFPDPEKFDPERFNDENKVHHTPFSYIPFGEGPRICIGLRFGLLQAKVGLVILLRNFRFLLNAKTRQPLEFDAPSIVLTAKGGIWLDVEEVHTTDS